MGSRLDDHNILCDGGVEYQSVEPPGAATAELIARFWTKVDKKPGASCWLWKGAVDRLGYGQFAWEGTARRAHRVAYFLSRGKWFAADVKMRHSCDVRACCNPAHLTPGTQADNMRDRRLREGYRTMRKGEAHRRAKLTAEAVQDIRTANPSGGLGAIAARYGVQPACVSKIRTGRAWAWLNKETT